MTSSSQQPVHPAVHAMVMSLRRAVSARAAVPLSISSWTRCASACTTGRVTVRGKLRRPVMYPSLEVSSWASLVRSSTPDVIWKPLSRKDTRPGAGELHLPVGAEEEDELVDERG